MLKQMLAAVRQWRSKRRPYIVMMTDDGPWQPVRRYRTSAAAYNAVTRFLARDRTHQRAYRVIQGEP